MRVSMKHNIIRYSLIVLLIGLGALPAGRAYAQEQERRIELLSFSYGVASGQTVRTSMFNPDFAGGVFVAARIQLLDMEGEVIAQSDEIRIGAGKIRFWDISRDQLRAEGDPGTGRLQVRTRILVTTESSDANCNRLPLAPTVELINPSTGETAAFGFGFTRGRCIPLSHLIVENHRQRHRENGAFRMFLVRNCTPKEKMERTAWM